MDLFQSKHVSCKPVTSLKSLLNFPGNIQPHKYNTRKLEYAPKNSNQRQLIVCHDMRNNYLDDRYFQGSNNPHEYTFYHWNLIDIFIYFSHHFITIPPESWINAAHENNVRILGTLITEWSDGYSICQELLKDKITVDKYVDKLVLLTLYYNFDGWLINIENKIDDTENLVYFVKQLTRALRSIDEGLYRVIWYDSVVETGELKWQNELNRSNECFFNVCDGIFINYTWTFENLANSGLYAERLRDIYIGVDVFGRNCHGGGGFSTRLAVEKIQEYDLSCAIFAPGWVIECNEAADFISTNDKFWHLLDSSTERRRISSLPVLTAFTHSRAERFFCLGENVSGRTSWCNLNLQSLMPVLNESSHLKWCFEDAFYAGSCLVFDNKASANKLFDLSVDLNAGTCLRVEYAVKVECSTAIDYVKKLKICLGYVTEENSNGVICSDSSVPISSDVEVIESNSSVNSSGWYLESFDALVKKCLSLTELTVVKSGLPGLTDTVKLGLLKVFVPNQNLKLDDSIPRINYKDVKVFRLNREIYFCVRLFWDRFSSLAKYYNIFIGNDLSLASKGEKEEKEEGNSNKMSYIGSTKLEDFRLCVKMNSNNISFDEQQTNEDEKMSKYTFKVTIQEFDEHFFSLVSGFKSASLAVPLLNFNIRNEDNLEYIGEIVYDFELF